MNGCMHWFKSAEADRAAASGLFNALVLDWVSLKCHTPMKPPSGGGEEDRTADYMQVVDPITGDVVRRVHFSQPIA